MGSDEKKRQIKMKKKKDSNKTETISDERFASAQSDPRFMEAPKRRSKVEIDSRFSRVFTDPGFATSNAPVDKRGKPRNKRKPEKATASLKHFYRLPDESNEKELRAVHDSDSDDDDRLRIDESSSSTSNSNTDSDDQFMDEEDEEEDTFMQPEANVPEIDKETGRLAVVNLDWSQVRAVDLYVLLSSFLPKGGRIMSVTVYPSEFGLKRMEEEAVHGPVGLFDDDEEHDDGEDDEIDNKKLRAYELSRLRYYYAVVVCDATATADYLYKTCDGVEFERSANKLDLRFIPDSLEFKHQPRDVATEAPADYEGLDFQTRALQHSNIHLTWDEDEPQRAKTFKRKLNDDQLATLEMEEFLASDDSETDDGDNGDGTEDLSLNKSNKRDKYRALIQQGDGLDDDHEEDNDQDMEVTFNSGLEDLSKRILENKDKKSETVWEAYLRKRKEKKKASKKGSKYSSDDSGSSDSDQEHSEQPDDFFVEEPSDRGNKVRSNKKRKTDQETKQEAEASRAELELLLTTDAMGADTNIKGYSLKPKKSKGKRGKAIQGEGKIPTVNYDDPRFSALFASPLYALDPTDPQFKRSAAYARQLTQKNKIGDKECEGQMDHLSEVPFGQAQASSMRQGENITSDGLSKRKEKSELSSLVRSLKMKSNQLSVPSKHKVSKKYKNIPSKAKIEKNK